MKLDELIKITRALRVDDDSDLTSGAPDRLTTDTAIALLLNEAQTEFACRTGWLKERAVPSRSQITLVASVDSYVYDAKILRVDGISIAGRNDELFVVDEAVLRTSALGRDPLGFLDGITPRSDATLTGLPDAYSLNAATRTIRLNRLPTASEAGTILNLRVVRLPLVDLTSEDGNASPEIPAEYHYALTFFAGAEILSSPGLEASHAKVSAALRTRWLETIEYARRKRIEAEKVTPVVRFGWR